MEHHVVRFHDTVGIDLDDIGSRKGQRTACAYCGVFRSRCLNLEAKRLGIDVLATGHNLDDTAQSVLMNFMRGDVERLARLGPHKKVQPGLVPRIEPLRLIPEKETYLYALLKGIEFSDAECPYAVDALRNEFREIVDNGEQAPRDQTCDRGQLRCHATGAHGYIPSDTTEHMCLRRAYMWGALHVL